MLDRVGRDPMMMVKDGDIFVKEEGICPTDPVLSRIHERNIYSQPGK